MKNEDLTLKNVSFEEPPTLGIFIGIMALFVLPIASIFITYFNLISGVSNETLLPIIGFTEAMCGIGVVSIYFSQEYDRDLNERHNRIAGSAVMCGLLLSNIFLSTTLSNGFLPFIFLGASSIIFLLNLKQYGKYYAEHISQLYGSAIIVLLIVLFFRSKD